MYDGRKKQVEFIPLLQPYLFLYFSQSTLWLTNWAVTSFFFSASIVFRQCYQLKRAPGILPIPHFPVIYNEELI